MKKKLTDILYSFSLLLFVIAFNLQHNPPGWYQQFLPDIGGRSITDIVFTDSLNGYAVTSDSSSHALILKTIDGGDSWMRNYEISPFTFNKIQFINENTGFAGGTRLLKTINRGENWAMVNTPFQSFLNDFHVLNEDTIWFAMSEGFTGGVFRTTNGGISWTQQVNLGNQNPEKIYMYNASIGFIAKNVVSPNMRKTTDGGISWTVVLNEGFTDMFFIDSLKGWKCWGERDSIKHTTDGGITWQKQFLPPSGGFFNLSVIEEFSVINADTIWGVGARAVTSLGARGLIYISTDGGTTWGYQLPDTNNITIGRYFYTDFVNKFNGWSYGISRGVHTVTGGDSTITGIQQVSTEIPVSFNLHQNYPNPFNPVTIIKYEIRSGSEVRLVVYDVSGKLIKVLVSQKQSAGTYQYTFDGSGLSSGVYFYSLSIDGVVVDTKKMILQK